MVPPTPGLDDGRWHKGSEMHVWSYRVNEYVEADEHVASW